MKTKKVLNDFNIFNFEPCIKWDKTSYMKWSHAKIQIRVVALSKPWNLNRFLIYCRLFSEYEISYKNLPTKCFGSFYKSGEKLSLARQLNKNAETRWKTAETRIDSLIFFTFHLFGSMSHDITYIFTRMRDNFKVSVNFILSL